MKGVSTLKTAGIVLWFAVDFLWRGLVYAWSWPATRILLVAILAAAILHICAQPASASQQTASPTAQRLSVPDVPPLYRLMVERETAAVWGIFAPTARIAAQIHQESLWNPKARSRYAHGMAQFTPATAEWIAAKFPDQLGAFDPWDPAQAVRGMVLYNAWLLDRVSGATDCDRWAFALSGYNGGLGWVKRDKQRASAQGADPERWFGHVEAHSARAGWAIRENRSYVSRILLKREPAYIAAGWSGTAVCEQGR
jgi:hypothetical protein